MVNSLYLSIKPYKYTNFPYITTHTFNLNVNEHMNVVLKLHKPCKDRRKNEKVSRALLTAHRNRKEEATAGKATRHTATYWQHRTAPCVETLYCYSGTVTDHDCMTNRPLRFRFTKMSQDLFFSSYNRPYIPYVFPKNV